MASKGYPIGARVLLDGKHEAIVKAYFPEGSTFMPFPYYTVQEIGRDGTTRLHVSRVGVTRKDGER